MNEILYMIIVPVAAGLLLFLIPEKARITKGILSLLIAILSTYFTIKVLFSSNQLFRISILDLDKYLTFNVDNLNKLIIAFIGLLSILTVLFSIIYIKDKKVIHYYSWFLITLGCAYGASLADNLLIFLSFWGILGITLYKLVRGNDEESSSAAKKTMILIGASDSIMIIGIAILWKITGTLNMSEIHIPTGSILAFTAFISLLTGSFTKAGAFPFHTWVPDYVKNAPASTSAYLPASLDKLLGIYFLTRIINGLFIPGEWIILFMLTLGVVTIITAVMMALIQHNYKQLLGYHAVSQVGYMILGLSIGSALGIAAGLFHMVNNALYKSGLFLSAGSIEFRTGKENIDDLGGLSKVMPFTFFSALIFAMAISGIPPFNGFASKWMIYQAIIDFGSGTSLASKLWFVWLGLAVIGSALTLASFIKFIGGAFLSRQKPEFTDIIEVPAIMWIPMAVLALLCLFSGVFATGLIVPKLLMPITGEFNLTGFWSSGIVSAMILISMLLGVLIYLLTNTKKFRTSDSFIGGEKNYDEAAYPTIEFYKTFREFRFFEFMYQKAQQKWFDIYELFKNAVLWISHILSTLHTGVLPGYIIWVFAGLLIMLLIMV